MAKAQKPRGTSLKRIVTEIHKARRKVVKREKKATPAQARRLDLKVKKLDKLESQTKAICSGLYA